MMTPEHVRGQLMTPLQGRHREPRRHAQGAELRTVPSGLLEGTYADEGVAAFEEGCRQLYSRKVRSGPHAFGFPE